MMLSRVADTLYWMSRYLERAEHTARLVDVCLDLIPDRSPAAISAAWKKVFACLRLPAPDLEQVSAYDLTHRLIFDEDHEYTLVSHIATARENARQVRELISSEMWEQINRLYLDVKKADINKIWSDQPYSFFQKVKDGSHLFQGIASSTMSHGEGWHFIQVGQYMERASTITELLHVHLSATATNNQISATDRYLDWIGVLRSCTALEAYCKVYSAEPQYTRIAEFLLMNPAFPHSVCFSVDRMRYALNEISEAAGMRTNKSLYRNIGKLAAMLNYDHIDEVIHLDFPSYLNRIQQQCALIHNVLFDTYINYPIDEKIAPL